MKLLKNENWWIWLLLMMFSNGTSNISLGALLDVFDKKAWYAKKRNWIIGAICFLFPIFIMAIIFITQITCLTAAKLNVKGSEYYLSPYVWLLLMIIPIIGWALLTVMTIYLEIWIIVALYKGEGNKYAE
ncbi:MAG: hypothetical protein RR050_02700 [Bacilli bacterium]